MGEQGKEKWDTEKMRELRSNWSLAADTQLLSCMQQFSQNLLSETHSTLKLFDSLESDIAKTCVEVGNIGNRFWALSDTQFVESRVYDDDDLASPTSVVADQEKPQENIESIIVNRLTDAVKNGIKVLDTKFETIEVSASDSEDDEDNSPHSGVVLKPVNRYKHRPLPHLIGSVEFRTDHTLGLREAPSDEDTEPIFTDSDKSDGESEDSGLENQPKAKEIKMDEEHHSILRPPGLSILNVQPKPQMNPVLAGGIFGEPEDNGVFFEQPGKKPLFPSWQGTDLWAPDDESQRIGDDNSANYRPPSADSSVSSAQSSIKSEPVKKTSEDFGISGSGRLPVSVQEDEDEDELFKPVLAPATKKPIPTGGVRIFGDDFNPFVDNSLAVDKGLPNKPTVPKRWENNDENSDASNINKISNKPILQNEKLSKAVMKENDDLFNSESDDELFPSSKPTKTTKISNSHNPPSKSLFNSSSRSSNDSLTSKSTSSPLFSEIKQSDSDKEDDLFHTKSVFSKGSKPKNPGDLFSRDLLGDAINNVFSSNASVIPKSKIHNDTLFVEDDDPLFSNIVSLKKNNSKSVSSNFEKDLFSDEGDLFGATNKPVNDHLFDKPSKNPNSTSKNTPKTLFSTPLRPPSKGLFDDDDDDDDALFSTNPITTVPSKHTVENRLDNKNYISDIQSKQAASINDENDLFSSSKHITEVRNDKVKVKSSNLKPKKVLDKPSLFDSDSDDGLFSSPQGSLSSRKSIQASNTQVVDKADVDKQQKLLRQGTNPTKVTKTDFSRIFSNESSDVSIFSNHQNVSVVTEDSLFPPKKSSFYETNNTNIDTPDLFTNITSQTTSKSLEPNIDTFSNLYSNNKETSSLDKRSEIEAVNSKLASLSKEVSNNVTEISRKIEKEVVDSSVSSKPEIEHKKPDKISEIEAGNPKPTSLSKEVSNNVTDISKKIETEVVDSSVSSKPEIKYKKPEPPRSLGVRPILETLSGDLPKENVTVSRKSVFHKKSLTATRAESAASNDVLDGEVITPLKAKPGKLNPSKLININPAALLPGAKPRPKSEQTPTSLEPDVKTNLLSEEVLSPPDSVVTISSGSPLTFVSLSPPSSGLESITETISPQLSELLPNVNKERPKIQGKRKPPSRQARQEAIKASSIEDNSETSSLPPLSSSNLMSPSTDEEDLFSAPLLDTVNDGDKTISPKTDIFGTPTVLSPMAKSEIPSPFVSPPFFQLQPPPLDDEKDEEASNHSDDICEIDDNFTYDVDHIQSKRFEKRSMTGDYSNSLQDDYLFSSMRDGPPPLIDDDEEEQECDDLFIRNKRRTITSSAGIPPGNALFASQTLSSENAVEVVTVDSLFASNKPLDIVDEDYLKPSFMKHSLNELENPLLNSSSTAPKANSLGDSVFSDTIKSQDLENDDVVYSKEILAKTSQNKCDILTIGSQTVASDDDSKSTQFTSSGQETKNDPFNYAHKKPDSEVVEHLEQSLSENSHNDEPKHSSLLPSNSLIKDEEINHLLNRPIKSSLNLEDDTHLFTQSTSSVKEEKHQSAKVKTERSSHPVSDVFKDDVNSYLQDEDSLFPQTTMQVKETGKNVSSLKSDKLGQVAEGKTTLFTPQDTQIRSSNAMSNILDDDDSLFKPASSISKQPTISTPFFEKETSHSSRKTVLFDDEDQETKDLFTKGVVQNSESQKTKAPVKEKQSLGKESLFFDDKKDEESRDLFSAKNKIKTVTPFKSSLFGDDGDEDDIFGSSAKCSSTKPFKKTLTTVPATKTSLMDAEQSKKGIKLGISGSSKPVKLEATQAFSDPLLSYQD